MNEKLKPATLCVQAGWTPKKGEPRVLPIYQSTTFKYETSDQMAACSTSKKAATSIHVCRIRPTMR